MQDKKNNSGDLMLEEADYSFEKKFWVAQKIAWGLIVIFLIASLLGYTGSGPLNKATKEDGALRIVYKPFIRQLAPTSISINLKEQHDKKVIFWIGQDYLDNYKIETITPEPDRVILQREKIMYEINAEDIGQAATVTFELQPKRTGYIAGMLGQGEELRIDFRQFSLP